MVKLRPAKGSKFCSVSDDITTLPEPLIISINLQLDDI
jgi:hypothetical protein